jgi:hypothetical protein
MFPWLNGHGQCVPDALRPQTGRPVRAAEEPGFQELACYLRKMSRNVRGTGDVPHADRCRRTVWIGKTGEGGNPRVQPLPGGIGCVAVRRETVRAQAASGVVLAGREPVR